MGRKYAHGIHPASAAPEAFMFVVEFPHRGRVTWDRGSLTVGGESTDKVEELRRAVFSLLDMEDVDVKVEGQVKTALLSMAGARVVRDTHSDGNGN